jgi:hypothetical protein
MINTAVGDEAVVQTVVNCMKSFDSKFNDLRTNAP